MTTGGREYEYDGYSYSVKDYCVSHNEVNLPTLFYVLQVESKVSSHIKAESSHHNPRIKIGKIIHDILRSATIGTITLWPNFSNYDRVPIHANMEIKKENMMAK